MLFSIWNMIRKFKIEAFLIFIIICQIVVKKCRRSETIDIWFLSPVFRHIYKILKSIIFSVHPNSSIIIQEMIKLFNMVCTAKRKIPSRSSSFFFENASKIKDIFKPYCHFTLFIYLDFRIKGMDYTFTFVFLLQSLSVLLILRSFVASGYPILNDVTVPRSLASPQ